MGGVPVLPGLFSRAPGAAISDPFASLQSNLDPQKQKGHSCKKYWICGFQIIQGSTHCHLQISKPFSNSFTEPGVKFVEKVLPILKDQAICLATRQSVAGLSRASSGHCRLDWPTPLHILIGALQQTYVFLSFPGCQRGKLYSWLAGQNKDLLMFTKMRMSLPYALIPSTGPDKSRTTKDNDLAIFSAGRALHFAPPSKWFTPVFIERHCTSLLKGRQWGW